MVMERNPDGTFAPGNAGGPGRPPRRTEREYLDAVMHECSLDDWRAVVRKAVEDAIAGDAPARRWLANYLVGKPAGKETLTVRPGPDLSDLLSMSEEQLDEIIAAGEEGNESWT